MNEVVQADLNIQEGFENLDIHMGRLDDSLLNLERILQPLLVNDTSEVAVSSDGPKPPKAQTSIIQDTLEQRTNHAKTQKKLVDDLIRRLTA